jgi:hypothetical protein
MFCVAKTPIKEAPDRGWAPSFWHDDKEYRKKASGICPDCVATHLKFNEEYGDYELLPDHPFPEGEET